MNNGIYIMTLTCDHTCDQAVTTNPRNAHTEPTVGPLPIARELRRMPGGGLIAELTIPDRRDGKRASTTQYSAVSPGELTVAYVTERLEQAGRTVLALPQAGFTLGIKSGSPDFVRQVAEAYGWDREQLRPAHPSNKAIDLMDEAYAWLSYIPDSRMLERRIVGIRSLVHPLTDRHLYPWRKIGTLLNLHHKSVQARHAEGIGDIIAGLIRANFFK